MNKNTYYVLGIMSGTSLDGIDIAYIKFERQKSQFLHLISLQKSFYQSYVINHINHYFK